MLLAHQPSKACPYNTKLNKCFYCSIMLISLFAAPIRSTTGVEVCLETLPAVLCLVLSIMSAPNMLLFIFKCFNNALVISKKSLL
jgi:hypothetical protein